MFKNSTFRTNLSSVTKGIYGKVYKGQAYVYIDGVLIDQHFNVIAEGISLTKAGKLITGYPNINGKSWFKKITSADLTDAARAKIEEMGLLNETHE